jgi:aryl-alcohol dehydrogenase-like predicted oxidoreductase
MKYRTLGKTGWRVSEIGFGAWGIGGAMWQGGDDRTALEALHAALDLGCTFIDTALAYGDGHSERLIAQVLSARPEAIIVASKVPPDNRVWPALPGTPLKACFPAGYVRECAERSADNLARPVDLLQFHVWRDEWLDDPDWPVVEHTLQTLVQAGTVRRIGISVNDHEPHSALRAVREWDLLAAVQVIYNVFDQTPARELFPACRERNIGVIARVPLDEGGLTGKINPMTSFPQGDWRMRYFRDNRRAEVESRARALEPVLLKEAQSLPEGAIRFCLSHPAVSTVIPGMRSPEHARANAAVSDGRVLSPALLAELAGHAWERNFYQ